MPLRQEAFVERTMLKWARERSGFTVAQVARKINVQPERVEQWELGNLRPTIIQLRKLANVYKRPIAVFYLPEPPKDFEPLRDYRRFPGDIATETSPELALEIRMSYERRESALDLLAELGIRAGQFREQANLDQDPEVLAQRIRAFLRVDHSTQGKWGGPYDAFNGWRAAVENRSALVFQMEEVTISEVRGFSISKFPLPVIVINRKDSPRGRIFTMLHEFVHILLRTGGLCEIGDDAALLPEKRRQEVFCNHVAGAVIVPRDLLLNESVVKDNPRTTIWKDEDIASIAAKYGASRETVLRRLLILGRTTEEFYQRKRDEYRREYEQRVPDDKPIIILPHTNVVSLTGKPFVRLVLDAFHQNKITASEVADYLDLRLKHFARLEDAVRT
jgi:Zn-dependent peptidase ImmA (M78 family)/DNA-binding XRE family transcriptional regulator